MCLIRLICSLISAMWVDELSGVIMAPRALVGLDSGIGEIGVCTPLVSYAYNAWEGVFNV